MFRIYSWKIIGALLLVLIVMTSCSQGNEVKQALGDYLLNEVSTTLETLQTKYNEYKDITSECDSYELELQEAHRHVVEQEDIVDILKVSCRYRNTKYLHPDYSYAAELQERLGEESRLLTQLMKREEASELRLENCLKHERQLEPLAERINKLQPFNPIWQENMQTWQLRQVQKNIYLVSGYGLGFCGSAGLCLGEWYYYVDENRFQPSSETARALLIQIANR